MNFESWQRMLRLAIGISVVTLGGVGSFASHARAADVATLQAKVDAAHSEARKLASTVELRNNQFQAAAAAAAAAAREQAVLEDQLAHGRARVTALTKRAERARRRLRRAQSRLEKVQGQLGDRLIAIYKSDAPDLTTVLLESDGFEDLLTRAAYLKQVNRADRALVDKIERLRDAVRGALKRVKRLKAAADAEVERLSLARKRISAVRRQAQAKAAEAQAARRTAQSALNELRSRMSVWRGQVAELMAATGQGGNAGDTVERWFDGFSIPKQIVMCESGGNYKALNPSSGAGGAYQLLPETYKALGGKYDAPNLAPKWEQDKLAAKLWNNGAGAGNWVCSQ